MRQIKFRVYNKKEELMFLSEGENCCSWDDISYDNPPVMQFTGYYDKDSKEIYEGDILALELVSPIKFDITRCTAQVKWIDAGFEFEPIGKWVDDWNFPDDADRTVVIGNIYQNPELLTKQYD